MASQLRYRVRSGDSSFHRLTLLLLTALMPVSSARAQAPEADTAVVFGIIEGVWTGEGTLFGRRAAFDMRWESLGSLAVLVFSNAMVDSVGRRTPILEAVALYRTGRDAPRATWEDSRGVRTEITWTARDSSLVANWVAPTESGRTTYTVHADGTLRVLDEVLGPEGMRPFGSATYRRAAR